MERSEEILANWFGERDDDGWHVSSEQIQTWFRGTPAVDEELRRRFAGDVADARAGRLAAWKDTARGRLALILLLDQLPRNLFRGTLDAFRSDSMALALAREAIERGEDARLSGKERAFLYLPLEHAEDREVQAAAVQAFRTLAREAPPEARESYELFLDYAVRHQEIIERFGRFPHRNRILGRPSTPEEEAFLLQPGSSF